MEPVNSTVSVVADETLRARSVSLAHRLLAGSGRASLVAYDLAPVVEAEAICHGMSDVGELMVAGITDADVPVTVWGRLPLRVRFDVTKEAPEWSVRITACAVHLLGTLEWLEGEVKDSYLSGAGLDPRLIEIASAPGGRLGVIRAERVLLHDSTGVTAMSYEEIAERRVGTVPGRSGAFPDANGEWAARELVGRLSPFDVLELLAAADAGWGRAIKLSTREQGGCPHLDGQVFCVDVDRTGLTLMTVEGGVTEVILFAFDGPAQSVEELADRIGQLLESAETQRAE